MLKPGPSLAMAACLSAAAILLNNTFAGQADWHSATNTMHYAALFVVGIFLARQKDFFRSRYGRMSRNGKLAIGLLSAIFYVYAAVLWQGLVRRLTSYDLFNSGDWLTAMGAAGLIVFSLNSARLRRVLLWPPIHALGKMSYSVYLLHLIVILLLVHLFYRKIPLLLLLTLCLVVTIAVSWAFYRFVELPCISLGRRLSGCL
jgi:peptidoglycan/LPS O-acetylase OafA/YrhL